MAQRVWFASQAAAERDGSDNIRAALDRHGYLWLYLPTPWQEDAAAIVDVTGRSAAHVDRLAREWIGHGCGPTKAGGRGVCGDADVAYGPPRDRWLAAERRAARVVSR